MVPYLEYQAYEERLKEMQITLKERREKEDNYNILIDEQPGGNR